MGRFAAHRSEIGRQNGSIATPSIENRRFPPAFIVVWLSCAMAVSAGCSGPQSALDPAGDEAGRVAGLFWIMATSGLAIWAGVVALLAYALRRNRRELGAETAGRLIFWGGAIFPTVVLTALLSYAFWLMPGLRPFAEAAGGNVRIEIIGRQFWWDVTYHLPDGSSLRGANEIVVPTGRRVEFSLASPDVIHSFWIPSLAGKMDLIPGRVNRLSVLAEKPGTYRGACAEYCGTSHAYMAISAIAMEPEAFDAWASRQQAAVSDSAAAGAQAFVRHGCGACHTVAGTEAIGRVGPDLTHVGSRLTIGAGVLPNTEENLARFIANSESIKPAARMPTFDMLPPEDIRAIAAWLKEPK